MKTRVSVSSQIEIYLHDDLVSENTLLDLLMRAHDCIGDDTLSSNSNISAEEALRHMRPGLDMGAPANDGVLDKSVVRDNGVLHEGAVGKASTVTNNHVRADNNIGADLAVSTNLGSGVNDDVADDVLALREGLGLVDGERSEVELGSEEEILGLADVHPVAVESHGIEVLVDDHGGEDLALDGDSDGLRVGFGNEVKDGLVEEVNTGVDLVGGEVLRTLLRLLEELLDETVLLEDDETILGRVFDRGDENGALTLVRLVEVEHLRQGELAGDIRVEHEEGLVVLHEEVTSKTKGTSGTKGLILNGEGNLNLELLLNVILEVNHLVGHVTNSKDNLIDTSLDKSRDLMDNNRLVHERNKGFRLGEGIGAKTSAETTDKNNSLHLRNPKFSRKRDKGAVY